MRCIRTDLKKMPARQLQDTLSEFGFTSEQAIRLCGLVRWALMDEAELARRDKDKLATLLDALAERGLFCDRESLLNDVFSARQDAALPWFTRLERVTGSEAAAQYGFHSTVSRRRSYALDYLSGYISRGAVEALATVIVWKDESSATQ